MATKKKGNTVSRVWDIAQPIADSLGLVLWDITFDKEGSLFYLRVLIDKEDGYVDMDDCEAMTRPLSDKLDEVDPIDESYMLEVGSAGLGRELKRDEHFLKYIGEVVRARFIREQDGVKEIIGSLESYDKENKIASISTDDGVKNVELSMVAHIKLCDDDIE